MTGPRPVVGEVRPGGADSRRCLTTADGMLRGTGTGGPVAVTAGWWPKACACLIRLALETGIDAYWRQTSPPVAVCASRRAKLLMLRRYADREVARRATFAWAALSRATHHHCYELAPTAAELRHLHAEVTGILRDL